MNQLQRKFQIIATIALLCIAVLASAQETQAPGATTPPPAASQQTSPDPTAPTAAKPMTKGEMKAQRNQQKADEKAASAKAKADKQNAKALKQQNKATNAQEKAQQSSAAADAGKQQDPAKQ